MVKTLRKRSPHHKAVTGAVLIAASLLTAVQAGDSPSGSHGKTRPPSNQRLQSLVADLGHSSYHRRETATKILARTGTRAVEPLLLAMSQQGPETVQRAQRILVQLVVDSEAVYLLLESMRDKSNQTARIAKKVIQTEPYQLAARTRHIQKVQSQIRLSQRAILLKQWKLAFTRINAAETLATKFGVLGECAPMIYNLAAIVEAKGEKTPAKIASTNFLRKEIANFFIRRSRIEIRKSDFNKAKWYASFARSLNVTYGMFEDRPALVFWEIHRLQTQARQATTAVAAVKPLSRKDKGRKILRRGVNFNLLINQKKAREIERNLGFGK
jgi:hypothetical protein